jgi:hypothetical protein
MVKETAVKPKQSMIVSVRNCLSGSMVIDDRLPLSAASVTIQADVWALVRLKEREAVRVDGDIYPL